MALAASRPRSSRLEELIFQPAPSWPGAEFGLAAPVDFAACAAQAAPASCGEAQRLSAAGGSGALRFIHTFGGPQIISAAAPSVSPLHLPRPPPGGSLLSFSLDAPPGVRLPAPEPPSRSISEAPPPRSAFRAPSAKLPPAPSADNVTAAPRESSPPLPHSAPPSVMAPAGGSALSLPAGAADFLAFLESSAALAVERNAQPAGPAPLTPFGQNTSSALYQQLLLQHWTPILERLAPVHKQLIWDTCKMAPGFKCVSKTSFRKVISSWSGNVAANARCIGILFGAIGFLKHHDVLKNEFCYPDSKVPVFRTFVNAPSMGAPRPSSFAAPPMLSPPSPPPAASKRPSADRTRDRSPTLEFDAPPPAKRSRVVQVVAPPTPGPMDQQ